MSPTACVIVGARPNWDGKASARTAAVRRHFPSSAPGEHDARAGVAPVQVLQLRA